MTLKILIDMNLSPAWVSVLRTGGFEAAHWSDIGSAKAPDRELLRWAHDNGHVVFTHDLDFGAILAGSGSSGPSVLQLRSQALLPAQAATLILTALEKYRFELEAGALVTVDAERSRVRILPL